jgi:hypothetical protein
LLPQAGLFGALFLAFAAALPSATEARIAGLQFVDFKSDVSANCTVRPAGRTWIRGAPPCSGPSALRPLLRRVNIGGKSSAALAAEMNCRKSPSNVSQFMHKSTGGSPHASASHRIVEVKSSDLAEWPTHQFEPVPDKGMIEIFTVGRLPDG